MVIELGEGFNREYLSNELDGLQSISNAKEWQNNKLDSLPESYLKFGNITLFVKRVYPNLKGDYEPKWIEV
jgi:hypothetical protein